MKTVLIVDDTKNIRMLLTTCLELKGYEVLTAEDGKSAINIIKARMGKVDLIFLDIRMPEMNGTEVFKVIRDMGVKCPVIIMTAYATVKNAIDCTKLGAAAYLQKPFSPDRVNSVLDEILDSNETYNENSEGLQRENFLIEKARKFMEQGEFKEAHNCLITTLSINPYNKEIYHLIGEINKNTNKPKEAKLFNNIYKLFNDENL